MDEEGTGDKQTAVVNSADQPPVTEEETSEKLVSAELSNPSSLSRENLINTAVSFLKHEKVRNTSTAHKKSFLNRKGLSEDEILEAFRRSGTSEEEAGFYPPQPLQPFYKPPPPIIPVTHVSSWTRIRETVVAGILLWGISKAAQKIYKEYVSPYFGIKSASERRMEVIENSVLEMQNNMVETMRKVQDVVDTIQQQQLLLNEELIKSNSVQYPQSNRLSHDIKSELTSIKGILLSRKQFTPIPNITATLPSWQLAEESSNASTTTTSFNKSINSQVEPSTETPLLKIKASDKDQINPVTTVEQSSGDSSDISPVNSEGIAADIEDLSHVDDGNNETCQPST
ncbi:peroxisomal membrane protein PEX14-like [Argonauta hians]